MVRAADIPISLLHAYVDALEAWGRLERELFMVWQLVRRSPNIEAAWEEFSGLSTSEQRKETRKLVEQFRTKTNFAPHIPVVFDRLKSLADTRNRIVHGRWQSIELVTGGKATSMEFVRLYDARGEPCRPVDAEEEKRMLGRTRFYKPELNEAERQFRDAARDIHHAMAAMVGSWRKWIA